MVCWLIASPAWGRSYRSVLKAWTHQARAYTFDNLEMRVSWHATYLSPEFREARRNKLAEMQEWSDEEQNRFLQEDEVDLRKYDDFLVVLYAGSSAWPELGKETGKWRFALQQQGKIVRAVSIERVPITEAERTLYPYLDKWSKAYRIRFPKTIQEGNPFELKMQGIPYRSQLTW